MSKADQIFIDNIKQILAYGVTEQGEVRPRWQDKTPARTISLFGLVNRYNLQEEFPIMTLKRTFYKSALEELLWIWQKKSNKVADLTTHIWDNWAKDGEIGKAYGYQLGVKHKYPEGEFDQVDRILFDLVNNPNSRRIIANMYVHQDLHEMNLYPCAYSLTLNVSGKVLNGILNQRSQDMAVANNWNVTQYAILLHLFASVSGLVAGELVHVIANAHIYDRHIPIVEQLIQLPTYQAPKFVLDKVGSFYDFTTNSAKLIDYKYNDFAPKFEVAI
ncbi:MAG: thymidylate synthase [Clostridia bacterium]